MDWEENIDEIENIYPSNISKERIHASDRVAIREIRALADEICRSSISVSYIHTAFNKFKNGIIYKRNGVPHAFCIWKVKQHQPYGKPAVKELYVYLVCGRKSEFSFLGLILYDLEAICMEENIQFISLEPVNNTVKQYYISHGFLENGHIINPSLLIKPVQCTSLTTRNSRRKTRRKRRSPYPNTARNTS